MIIKLKLFFAIIFIDPSMIIHPSSSYGTLISYKDFYSFFSSPKLCNEAQSGANDLSKMNKFERVTETHGAGESLFSSTGGKGYIFGGLVS